MKSYNQKNKGIFFFKLERDEISALERANKNLFLNFEPNDLAIYMVDVYKILCTSFHTSYVQEPIIRSV